MRQLRGLASGSRSAADQRPGKLTRAMGIDKSLYGHDLSLEPLQVLGGGRLEDSEVAVTERIGISVAKEAPLRFCVADSKFLSRKVPVRPS